MWAPDAAEKGGRYYLYFPVKDKQDVFRIGAAVGTAPQGPFKAQPEPIKGTYSIDPAVFKDTDGQHYYFGGIWGGQLQRWASGSYVPKDVYPSKDQLALSAKVARLERGHDQPRGVATRRRPARRERKPLAVTTAGASSKRHGCTVQRHVLLLLDRRHPQHHVRDGRSPYGPFTVRGKVLEPVLGWTNHHSIVEFKGKWHFSTTTRRSRWSDPPAQHQGDRAEMLSFRRND